MVMMRAMIAMAAMTMKMTMTVNSSIKLITTSRLKYWRRERTKIFFH